MQYHTCKTSVATSSVGVVCFSRRDTVVVKPLEAVWRALERLKADDVLEFEIQATSSGASNDDKKPTVECTGLNGRDDSRLGLDVMFDV